MPDSGPIRLLRFEENSSGDNLNNVSLTNSLNSYLLVKDRDMITKKQLTLTLEQFPDEFTLEELIDKVILLDKIERGNQQSERNEVLNEEELENEMQKRFK